MNSSNRQPDGFAIDVLEPRGSQRFVDGILNVTLVPLSWVLSWFALEPPLGWQHASRYRVVVRNERGRRRTLAVVDTRDEADARRAREYEQLEAMGFEAWAHENRNRIPRSFFGR